MEKEIDKVMTMIESGVINSKEAQQLIQTIYKAHQKVSEVKKKISGRLLHIGIDSYKSEQVVEIKLPVQLMKSILAMEFIQKQVKSQGECDLELDLQEVINLINDHYTGELMMIESHSANVRVWVD